MQIKEVYFKSELEAKKVKKKVEIWKLTKDLICAIVDKKDNEIIHIAPKGFQSDGASVPRLLWWLYPPWGVYAESAVMHDYFYRNKKNPVKRNDADWIFYISMLGQGVRKINAIIIYSAVRTFGYFVWRQNRKK